MPKTEVKLEFIELETLPCVLVSGISVADLERNPELEVTIAKMIQVALKTKAARMNSEEVRLQLETIASAIQARITTLEDASARDALHGEGDER